MPIEYYPVLKTVSLVDKFLQTSHIKYFDVHLSLHISLYNTRQCKSDSKTLFKKGPKSCVFLKAYPPKCLHYFSGPWG